LNDRVKIIIRGAVQGVGFRPFVYRLATELGIKGWIINSSQGVFIEAEAERCTLDLFLSHLQSDKPKNSFIQSFEHSVLDYYGYKDFEIRESTVSGVKTALVLPDISTCDECLEEILDANNRRYLYPFTNCTNCGPRFSIIQCLPYDRANTTMGEFEMCPECRAEYKDPLNRRFHAEPTACPVCGPQLTLLDSTGKPIAEKNNAMTETVRQIKEGRIIALKGIGGFQLLCDARSGEAVKQLRTRKRRSEKPFALMFPSLDDIKKECEVSAPEERLLSSVEAPIVLLRRKKGVASVISSETAKGNPYFGIMLPYSPLHHVLMKELGFPIIATSGNISEEPICIDEFEALEKLRGIADFYLVHNRKIQRHVDDSIARIAEGREMLIRRARGYAPLPVLIKGLENSFLAFGPHLKNTIAINKGNNVFISQHIGDLENIESINAFKRVACDLQNFYDITPEKAICDLHPEYISTKFAKELHTELDQVQHHYAHVLSCVAENEIEGDVLGVSWDGTGYGSDGTIWGGEFIIPQGRDFERAAYLKPFRLPGGEQAIRDVWRIGFALLYDVFGAEVFRLTNIEFIHRIRQVLYIKQMLDKNINSPVTSSMGRLFDGVSAILGIRSTASFEAQAAMELEFAASDVNTSDHFKFKVEHAQGSGYVINWHVMLRELVTELNAGVHSDILSAKFHNTLSEIIIETAKLCGIEKVVLTGGCFQNRYLLEKSIQRLREEKFKVYWHQRVPTNDGGISLGQIKYSSFR
jgi:hydrogenase maturation protein HypF